MNRTNRTSDFRRSGVKAGVRALPEHHATNIRGGMGHKSAGRVFHRHFPYPIVLPWLVYYYPARPCRYRGKGQDGSDPPLFAALSANMAGVWGRVCYRVWGIPCPPLWGSLPSNLSLREGSEHPIPSSEGFYRPGPRRQGFANRFAPCDFCGPIQRQAYTRGCFFTLGFHSDNK